MGFELVESSVLQIFKAPIKELVGFVDHYYLAETANRDNSMGWGPSGLELQGLVKVTEKERDRLEEFMSVAKYNIAVNNCEHFANYVLFGLKLSSQQHTWWKCRGAEFVSLIQPVQSVGDNYNSFFGQKIAEVLKKDLKQMRLEQANQERIEFWKSRGIDLE
jgi:hypothetical protein